MEFRVLSFENTQGWDAFNFEIVNFPFLDGYVPLSPSYGIYISQLFVLLECVLMLMTSTTETYF